MLSLSLNKYPLKHQNGNFLEYEGEGENKTLIVHLWAEIGQPQNKPPPLSYKEKRSLFSAFNVIYSIASKMQKRIK